MSSVLNFGSLNLDYVYGVDHFVEPGETLSSTSYEVFAGGKGLNQSIAFARAGCKVFHAGCVGLEDGALLLNTLKEAGADVSNVRQLDDTRSGHTIIEVDKHGQNRILLYGGANHRQSREHIKEVIAKFAPGDLLMMQNEINDLGYIMQQAHERGLKIAFNVSPFSPALLDLPLNLCTYLLVNEVEAAAICKVSPATAGDELIELLSKILPKVNLVLTLGSQGSIFKSAEGEIFHQGIYKVKPVDTTAAGDTYTGFLLGLLLQGKSISEALPAAACAAAIATTVKGAGPSIPSLQQVMDSKLFAEGGQ